MSVREENQTQGRQDQQKMNDIKPQTQSMGMKNTIEKPAQYDGADNYDGVKGIRPMKFAVWNRLFSKLSGGVMERFWDERWHSDLAKINTNSAAAGVFTVGFGYKNSYCATSTERTISFR